MGAQKWIGSCDSMICQRTLFSMKVLHRLSYTQLMQGGTSPETKFGKVEEAVCQRNRINVEQTGVGRQILIARRLQRLYQTALRV